MSNTNQVTYSIRRDIITERITPHLVNPTERAWHMLLPAQQTLLSFNTVLQLTPHHSTHHMIDVPEDVMYALTSLEYQKNRTQ